MERMTWESFLCDIKTIYNLSLKFNDDWRMVVGVRRVKFYSFFYFVFVTFSHFIAFQNDDIGGTYLVKNKTMALKLSEKSNSSNFNENEETFTDYMDQNISETACESSANCTQCQLIKFEYHVLYHISYAVPYLCFNAYKSSTFISIFHSIYMWNLISILPPIGLKMVHCSHWTMPGNYSQITICPIRNYKRFN